ncbi:transglutaminase-like cysteine peptidase [Phenylobacterium deserti]|uniref:Transglutaminase n=1 Tax=Phenylobacterium deserti TaxID=1914756 RepID=A0A328ADR9_9CAUL|nr:transglutaminase-like cysteine peptidase [Phenylobacterium deserti]RAK52647.1 hypothetical protein DJ018_10615 [Phenylobacterium deserti]
MRMGATALPPEGYVAFCQRRPEDCGADIGAVILGAARAQADRAALLAALSPAQAMSASATPAATGLSAPAPTAPQPLVLTALPELLTSVVERQAVTTHAVFVTPGAPSEEASQAPAMTPELWAKLNRVNAKVNRAIARRTDAEGYGRTDYWAAPIAEGRGFGDCEDYVLEKQRQLADVGVPREALNIALATTSWGESHAVLLVSTREGEYVLDNLNPWVRPWRAVNYRWGARQVNGEAFSWAMVQDPKPQADMPRGALLIASIR